MIKRQATPNIQEVHKALKSYRESIGKITERIHYINEARLINYSLTGENRPICNVKHLNRLKRKQYAQVICINRELICNGVDYRLRKQVCRQVIEKQRNKTST